MKRIKLIDLLDHNDSMFILSDMISWDYLKKALSLNNKNQVGRPELPFRLMVGLHLLKYLENKSDEEALKEFLHNPYWQYFCGCEYFEHEIPFNSSSMTKWRKKLGPEKLEKLLEETLEAAERRGLLNSNDFKKINIDTTVQEKGISYPTDAKLYHKMRRKLVKAAKKRQILLRQNYERVGQTALMKQGRYLHARQIKRSKKEIKKLKNYLGRVTRDIERKALKIDSKLKFLLDLSKRLLLQKKDDKNKIYSLHAPEVECISKGKVHKKYEFGCKVSLATTTHSNWIVGVQAYHGNPYDGHTLKSSIDQVKKITGQSPKAINVDKGYKGKKNHPDDINVFISKGKRSVSPSIRKFMNRRSAIEPIIGHLKSDHRMNRNLLLGKLGDKINAILSACAFNLKKILNLIEQFPIKA